jgi:ParB-like chromosome segregation protein Spo0J
MANRCLPERANTPTLAKGWNMSSATGLKSARTCATNLHLTVVERLITELKPSACNPRRHSHKQIDQIAQSIRAFRFNVPILIDAEMNVIAGHGRLLAGQKLGLERVPTIQLEHLSQAQARAFIIADNKLASNSTWDDDLLARELEELSMVDLSFDLETIGFDTAEIDLRIGSIKEKSATDVENVSQFTICKSAAGRSWSDFTHDELERIAQDGEIAKVFLQFVDTDH